MTSVAVYSYTHSVTYVADNILKSFKDIIRLSGLDPGKLVDTWAVLMRGITAWLASGHLECVVLEVYNPSTGALIGRWDIDVLYGVPGDGSFWTDTDQIKYHILKAGLLPSQASYRLVLRTKPGSPHVDGWSDTEFLSTDGFVRQSLGSTIEHNGLGGSVAYWRKAG
jgi:Bacterial HORMA domain 2